MRTLKRIMRNRMRRSSLRRPQESALLRQSSYRYPCRPLALLSNGVREFKWIIVVIWGIYRLRGPNGSPNRRDPRGGILTGWLESLVGLPLVPLPFIVRQALLLDRLSRRFSLLRALDPLRRNSVKGRIVRRMTKEHLLTST